MFAALHIHLGFVIFSGPRSDLVWIYIVMKIDVFVIDVFYTIQGLYYFQDSSFL